MPRNSCPHPPPPQGRQSYLKTAELWGGHDGPVLCPCKDHLCGNLVKCDIGGNFEGGKPGRLGGG